MDYFRQETVWTCGSACLRMVLGSLGVKITETEITKKLGTNRVLGTQNKNFPAAAERLGFSYIVGRNSSIQDLKMTLKSGYKIIVGIYLKNEKKGHFAVIKKITKTHIYLLDPERGPNIRYKISNFIRIWKNDPKLDAEKRWFIGIKK